MPPAIFEHDDRAVAMLGIEVTEAADGRALARMAVRHDMTQGHGICHGGVVFALADTAFAYACNSRGRSAVAASAQIEFLRPAHEGDVLVARATEVLDDGRRGVYDVEVRRQEDGSAVALFRGRCAAVRARPADGGSGTR
jgi:phenylacetic acid degradation protein PaaD